MIHIYALTDAAGSSPALLGIDDSPVEVRAAGAVAAAVSRHDAAPEPTAEALLRHAVVVEALHQHRAVLPARFGTGVPDEGAVDDLLAQPGLSARLDRVRDHVEVDVRLVSAETPVPAVPSADAIQEPRHEHSGREHLRALAARAAASGSSEGTRQAAVDAVRMRLESLASGVVERPPGSARVLRHTALLLNRPLVDAFGRAVAEVAAELAPAHTVLCTGPWPPYNFVDDAKRPAAAPMGEGAR